MKKQVVTDERVVSQKRIVASGAFQIVMIGLLFSSLVQKLYFNAPFSQYAVEMGLFLIGSTYILIGNVIVGNDVFGSKLSKHKVLITNSFAVASGMTIAFIFNGRDKIDPGSGTWWMTVIVLFICSLLVSMLLLNFFYKYNKRKQEKIDAEISDDGIE